MSNLERAEGRDDFSDDGHGGDVEKENNKMKQSEYACGCSSGEA